MHSLTKRLISLTAAMAEVCIECAERANASYEIMIQAVSIIVREEIQAYFAGDKTIENVMAIIQNRVDLCMNERG